MDKQIDDKPTANQTNPVEQVPAPNHAPQNSYGSQQPFKLASSRQPVLIVLLIFVLIGALVLGYFVLQSMG